MPSVAGLFRAPKRAWPMEELPEVRAVEEGGFEGCADARPGGRRQVLLVDEETLDARELSRGMIRENITTRGLNVNGLKEGEPLSIGEAVVEVTMACTPSSPMDDL
jgi:MOSC domain-containing protein YiiM